ncbi:hypothetical protein BDR07DRAFT_1407953 [Suillus spraguei]|nr:hypothetical protein BDR07DRAFT_1407953 [Suillus spraguei]
MPLIPSDPTSWSFNTDPVSNYFIVASSTAVIYDWVLTFGQEYELIWTQRRSLMTALYIIVRCIGSIYSVSNVLLNLPGVLKTAKCCNVMNLALSWTIFIVNPMLSVILITRLHAMYQRSRKILVFLVGSLCAVLVTCGVVGGIGSSYTPANAILLDGTQCISEVDRGGQVSILALYILATVWHVLTLCLAIWIFVKHLRELQPPSTGKTFVGDCFMVLIRTQIVYFAFITLGCALNIGLASSVVLDTSRVGTQVYRGFLELVTLFQMFVIGPRLILSVREHHAEFLANSDRTLEMPTLAFEERLQESSSDSDA